MEDDQNVVVTYHNPLDNVADLAHHFFTRCLAANIVPYVVTKKTVFKWQEPFWAIMKDVFDKNYREKYMAAGIIPDGKLVRNYLLRLIFYAKLLLFLRCI